MSKTIKDYFSAHELVPKDVYDKYGEGSWKFIDQSIIDCIMVVREGLGKPMTINNWFWGKQFSQRGLRPNTSPMVKGKSGLYLSGHCFGKAVDFDVEGMTAVEVRAWIVANADKFPYKIRLERNMKGKPINWVHMDTMSDEGAPKVYQFDV